jgi:hypothetical protein
VKYALALVLLFGCAGRQIDTTATPKHRVPVHVNADVTMDVPTVLMWVDMRLDEWVRNKAAWGCAEFSDDHMVMLAQLEPVIVYRGAGLEPLPGVPYLGYNEFNGDDPAIHVTLFWPSFPISSDLINGAGVGVVPFDYSYGLRQLPHEWTHTARGYWHPQ